MKTITGNTVRAPFAFSGTKVATHAEACEAIGFEIISEPAARLSTGKALPNTQNLYNSQTGECLGQHTPRFKFLQPCESLETLEKARELVGGTWASVRANKGGRQIAGFISIANEITAPKRGDKIGLSVAFFDDYEGKGKTRLQLFANILACNNGMTRAESLLSFASKHGGSLKARFDAMRFQLLVSLQDQIEEMTQVVAKLDNAPMTAREVEAFAEQLFPARGEDGEVSARTENVRNEIVTGFSRGTGNVGATRWDAFNSVTEFLDWNATNKETEFSRDDNRFENLTRGVGARTRERALELLLN